MDAVNQDLLSMAGDAARIARPLANAVVDTWLKPKLEKFFSRKAIRDEVFESAFSDRFRDYLTRSYERHSYITTLVFPNQKLLLSEFFVHPSLQSQGEKAVIQVKGYPAMLIPAEKHVLITDAAGMGKSTILKYLFLECVSGNHGIPIFVELRKLGAGKSLLDFILAELNSIDEDLDPAFVKKLIARGDFVFFLDGFDEIPFDDREEVTRDLQAFVAKAAKNHFVIASRPDGALAAFPAFQNYRVLPLRLPEAFELIRKYDKDGALAEELITKLEKPEMAAVREFLQNPLLVSLLYRSYEYKQVVHFKKHIFYRQVYDALFESHDLTKGGGYERKKHCQLDIEDFHRAVRALAIETVRKGKVEFSRDELVSLLTQAKRHLGGLNFKEGQLLRDLLSTVPLFVSDGDMLRWAHKSIQEYFAASFVCGDTRQLQGSVLLAIAKSEHAQRYLNLLDLCFDIDYKSFRQSITHELVRDFIAYCDSSYAQLNSGVSSAEREARQTATFGTRLFMVASGTRDADLESLSRRITVATGKDAFQQAMWVALGEDAPAFVLCVNEPWATTLQVLSTKKEGLFAKQSSVRVRSRDLDAQLTAALSDGELREVTDSPDNPLNSSALFAHVTGILMEFSSFRVGRPALHRCREALKKIQAEIKVDEAQGDHLLRF